MSVTDNWQAAIKQLRMSLAGSDIECVTQFSPEQWHVRLGERLHIFIVRAGKVSGYCGEIEYSRAFHPKTRYNKLSAYTQVEPTCKPVQLRLL